MHRWPDRRSVYHLLRLHRTLTFPSLSSMAPYPCVAVQNVKDVPLPFACQPYLAQPFGSSAVAVVRLYFLPLHSRTFCLSSTRSGYVVPSTSHPSPPLGIDGNTQALH